MAETLRSSESGDSVGFTSPGVPSGRPSDAVRSTAISIARILCLLGITYVHAWFGLTADQFAAQKGSANSILYWMLADIFGRNSVPLLSIISGWLLATSSDEKGYAKFLRGKARTLLVPMILWNALIIGSILAAGAIGLDTHLPDLWSPPMWPLINEIANVTSPATINYPSAFLRDIFICMALSLIFLRLPVRWLWAVLAFALLWSITQWQIYLLLRPQILLFFLLGILVRRTRSEHGIARFPKGWVCSAFVVAVALKVSMSIHLQTNAPYTTWWQPAFDNAVRLVAAVFYWQLALRLAESRYAIRLKDMEQYGFLMFCSHILVFKLMSAPIQHLGIRFDQPAWALYFLLHPVIAFAAAWVIGRALLLVSPFAAGLLSGGRLKRKKERAPVADALPNIV